MRPASLLIAFCLASAAWAQDVERGRLLYETHCGGCHYERVHERLKSEIRDLADLRGAVARWAPQTKHRFSLEEIEDVVQYLNATHYRLGSATAREQRREGR